LDNIWEVRIIVRVENTTTILATVEPTQNKKNEKGRIQKRGGRKIKQETLIHNGAGGFFANCSSGWRAAKTRNQHYK